MGSHKTLFRTVPIPMIPDPLRPPLPQDGEFATLTQTAIAIIPGTAKATDFQFCMHILSIDRNKKPLQTSGKAAVGVVRTLEIYQGTIERIARSSLR